VITLTAAYREPRVCGTTDRAEDACWDSPEGTQVERKDA